MPDLTVAEVRHLIDEGMRPKFIDARDPIAWQSSAVRSRARFMYRWRQRPNTWRRFRASVD